MTELILHHERDAIGRNETDAQGSASTAGMRLEPGDKGPLPACKARGSWVCTGGLPGSQVIPQTGIKNC